MDFVIERSKWRCGKDGFHAHGEGQTRMTNSQGFMCCLGSCARQLGQDDSIVRPQAPTPAGFFRHGTENIFVKETGAETELTMEAMRINDNSELDDERREELLTSLFEREGHSIKFVGEYTKWRGWSYDSASVE